MFAFRKTWIAAVVAAGVIGFTAVATAQDAPPIVLAAEQPDDDPFADFLYDPELVFENADAIGLTNTQRELLIDRVVDVQAEVTRTELKAAGAFSQLLSLLQADTIDGDAVMPLVEQLFQVENDTKRRYLALMIDLHNMLTPPQRQMLDDLRD